MTAVQWWSLSLGFQSLLLVHFPSDHYYGRKLLLGSGARRSRARLLLFKWCAITCKLRYTPPSPPHTHFSWSFTLMLLHSWPYPDPNSSTQGMVMCPSPSLFYSLVVRTFTSPKCPTFWSTSLDFYAEVRHHNPLVRHAETWVERGAYCAFWLRS